MSLHWMLVAGESAPMLAGLIPEWPAPAHDCAVSGPAHRQPRGAPTTPRLLRPKPLVALGRWCYRVAYDEHNGAA